LPFLTSIWLPLLLRRSDPDDEFLYGHATGASVYQACGMLGVSAIWFGRGLPAWFLSQASASFAMALWGIVGLTLIGVYAMYACYLAFTAWNGDPFWAPLVGWLLGCDPPPES
jgi:hypothetical protein